MNKTEILLWGSNGYNETRKSSSTAGSGKAGFRSPIWNKSKKKRRTRLDRNDDGTGTLERYKKDSFYRYQNVIKTNGACLNEQVKKITRHFVLRKEKIVHEKVEVIVRTTEDNFPPQEKVVLKFTEQTVSSAENDAVLSYPGLEIHLEHHRVFKNGQEVYMSRYEYGVLSLMARHPGQLFTKEQIFEAVWHQDSESCLTAVTNAIGRIRQKIEDDRAAPVYIRTISNLGYQFMPTVSAESVEKDS